MILPLRSASDIRRLAAATGLEVVGLHWLLAKTSGLHLTSPEPEVRRRTADYLADLARLCRDLGGSILVLGSPHQRNLLPGVTAADGMKYAAEVIQRAMPAFEETDTVLAVEPLTAADGNFLLTAAEGVELVRQVGSPHCPAPSRLQGHVERTDADSGIDPPAPRRPGSFPRQRSEPARPRLRPVGFQADPGGAAKKSTTRGWVSVEVFDYAPGPERLARESVDYLRSLRADEHTRPEAFGAGERRDGVAEITPRLVFLTRRWPSFRPDIGPSPPAGPNFRRCSSAGRRFGPPIGRPTSVGTISIASHGQTVNS